MTKIIRVLNFGIFFCVDFNEFRDKLLFTTSFIGLVTTSRVGAGTRTTISPG